jgi:hypothetical protein
MKNFCNFFFLFGAIVLMTLSCEEDTETPCACGIENPQENIEWLNAITQNGLDNGKVYSFYSDNNEYILIEGWFFKEHMQIYNCNGDLVCEIGGFIGVGGECNMPVDYSVDFEKSKKLIYPID